MTARDHLMARAAEMAAVPRPYVKVEDLGVLFTVQAATVLLWRRKYTAPAMPEPDEMFGQRPAWLRSRLPEIVEWKLSQPGPGRPRKQRST